MESPSAGPLPADIRRHLATARLGQRVYFYPEIDSTNDVALALAREGEPEGTVVVADHQRRGRGRRGNAWHSPPGRDIMCSLILRPESDARGALAVTLVAAAAIAVALSRLLDAEHRVKWPNDVVSPRGKIAGLLAESSGSGPRVDHVVVGMGINVNSAPADWPEELRASASSCKSLTGAEWDRARVLADVLGSVEAYYDRFRRDGFAPLIAFYESRLVQMNRRVTFASGDRRATGTVTGVASDGALRVRREADGSLTDLYNETVEVME